MGRPDAAIVAAVTLSGEGQPMGHVITLMSKAPAYSKTPEMRHIAASTYDPAKRREKALQFFSEAYYQNYREFSDEINARLGNRPKMYPGFIGGHCVIPNLDLVNNQTLNLIKKINLLYSKKVKNSKSIFKLANKSYKND